MVDVDQSSYSLLWMWSLRDKIPKEIWSEYSQWYHKWKAFQEGLSSECVSHSQILPKLKGLLKKRSLRIVEEEYAFGRYRVDYLAMDSEGKKVAIELGGLFTRNPRKKLYDLCQGFDYVIHVPSKGNLRIYSKTKPPPEPPVLPLGTKTWIDNYISESIKEQLSK